MMITTTLVRKIAVEMAGLVRTPTEWYAIGTAFHQDAICRRSLDEGEPREMNALIMDPKQKREK